MDDVGCSSSESNFVECSTNTEDCSHSENVLLTCGPKREMIVLGEWTEWSTCDYGSSCCGEYTAHRSRSCLSGDCLRREKLLEERKMTTYPDCKFTIDKNTLSN